MKIDLDAVEKVDLTLEKALVLVNIEYIRRGKKLPYTSIDQKLYIELVQEGILKVTADGYSISTEGYQKFRKITGQPLLKLKEDPTLYKFDEWWDAFPYNDAHGDWVKRRTLRSDRAGCKKRYYEIISNKEATHEMLMKALKIEVDEYKRKSITNNRMSFMKNSRTWLNQKEFEIILEEHKGKDSPEEDGNSSWTDTVV